VVPLRKDLCRVKTMIINRPSVTIFCSRLYSVWVLAVCKASRPTAAASLCQVDISRSHLSLRLSTQRTGHRVALRALSSKRTATRQATCTDLTGVGTHLTKPTMPASFLSSRPSGRLRSGQSATWFIWGPMTGQLEFGVSNRWYNHSKITGCNHIIL